MRSGHFRLRSCPLIYHQKSGQKRGVTWWRLFKKCALAISGPGVATSYTTRKTEQMETAAAYFFEKPPLTNRDIFGWFSDWPSGNFSKSFSAYPAGAARYALAGKNFLSYIGNIPRHFFAISKWGSRKFFDTALCSGRDATGQEKGAALWKVPPLLWSIL